MSNVRDFGAAGDGRMDDTESILHALQDGDGVLYFPPGDYLLTRTVRLELGRPRRVGVVGAAGTAKIIMAGAGPAFHLVGTHGKTAEPADFQPGVWAGERLPTLLNLEIEGRHPQAGGVLLEGTMQATCEGLLLRDLEHGIRIAQRARNVLISHCHIYNMSGTGVWMDAVNLHQAIVTGSHISYCRRGGVKVTQSEIRNLQITGNDIEYNFDSQAPDSADVLIDASADGATVREGTIVGNTIQARYSPGGANVRIIGQNPQQNHKAGMFTITGNLIGSQEINVHLVACRGVVVSGNVIYSGHRRNLQLDGSRNIAIGPNSFDHNPDYGPRELCTGIRLADSHDCTLTGCLIQDCQTGQSTVTEAPPAAREALLEIVRSRRINVSGCQILDGFPYGMFLDEASQISVTGCQIMDTREEPLTKAAIRWQGTGQGSYVSANTLVRGAAGPLAIEPEVGVKIGENLIE